MTAKAKASVKAKASTKPTARKSKVEEDGVAAAVAQMYANTLAAVEKKYRLSGSSGAYVERFSSGSLMLDLVMAGGYYPGRWYTHLGLEASGKSTALMSSLANSLDLDVPYRFLWDYEGSMDWGYFSQMLLKPFKPAQLFGAKDDNGKVIKRGLVNYYDEDVAEVFFDSMGSLLRQIPRKVWVPERKAWYLVFENKKENAAFKESADRKLSDGEWIFIPCPNGLPQALIFLDSYPAMLPEGLDADDKSPGMAAQARMFSEKLKLVKPKLRRRHCSIIGVNGIRLRPGVSFGSPEYEPCGEALKFVSDCRIRHNSVGVPKHCNGTGPVAEEKSVDGEGTDRYRYSTLKTRKNKMGPNFMEGWSRIWMADSSGKGHGIDPVFDTWQFLRSTGWLTGSMNKMELTVPNTDKTLKMGWQQLKELVLLKGEDLKPVHKSLKLKDRLNIRQECFKLLKTGGAVKNYFETQRGGAE